MAKESGKTNRIDDEPNKFSREPPTSTEPQELPFLKLTWEDFERLCYQLIKKDAKVDAVKYYRTKGHRQYGIDIIAWIKNKRVVYECKRHKNYTPFELAKIIKKFQNGKWCQEGTTFIFCMALPASNLVDTIDDWKQKLHKEKNVNFQVWDSNDLSTKLKEYPYIVSSFFGEAWVKIFCKSTESTLSEKSERISKEELRLRVGLSVNPNFERYFIALQTVVTKRLAESEFDLISDRKIVTIKQQNTDKFEVKTRNAKSYTITDLLKKDIQLKNAEKPLVIIGEMGVGKSTFVLQIINHYLVNLKPDTFREYYPKSYNSLPFFIELRGLEEQSLKKKMEENFVIFVRKYLLSQLTRRDEERTRIRHQFIQEESEMLSTIKHLLKIPTTIILDGLDEFQGDSKLVFELADILVAKKHQVIITSREHTVRNIRKVESQFYSEELTSSSVARMQANDEDPWANFSEDKTIYALEKTTENNLLEIYKLENFTDNQVHSFIANSKKIINKPPPSFTLIREMAPETKRFPELNFRNPLVLQAILSSKYSDKVSAFAILRHIARYTFSWYIKRGKTFSIKLLKVREDYENDVSKNIQALLEIHQKLASSILLNENQNLKIKIFQMVQKKTKYQKPLIEFFIENTNMGFIQEVEGRFEIIPDRMFDFFIIGQITSLIKAERIKEVISLLLKIMGNTVRYRNLVDLFAETFMKELEEAESFLYKMDNSANWETEKNSESEIFSFFQKFVKDKTMLYDTKKQLSILLAIITQLNNNLRLLHSENFCWHEPIVLTNNQTVIALNFSHLKQKSSKISAESKNFFRN